MTIDFTPRPTVYKGIKMRSRLEAGFAKWLDVVRFDWQYEPHAFASERGQYLPDFLLKDVPCSWLGTRAPVYVEVKPAPFLTLTEDTQLDAFEDHMRRMAIIWESEPDAVLMLAVNTDAEEDRLGILDMGASPSESDPFPWPCRIELVYGPGLTPALAQRLEHLPFSGRYWELGR